MKMLTRGLRLAAALAVLVLLGVGSARAVPGASAQGDIQGDVTCDSSVNSVDSLQILRDVAGLGTAAACLAGAGDVNCDDAVNSVDALRILRYVAGLPVIAPDGCAPIGEPLGLPPTSEELIAAALDAGDITYEESLLYRAYALYDHPDLPDEFRSPVVDRHAAMGLFAEVLENEATLSPQLLDDLAPFTVRPADPISIFNNPPARQGQVSAAIAAPWVSVPAAGGMARVWVQQSALTDEQLEQYASETTRVWNALDGIFRYGLPDTPGAPAVNPDSAIDLYFANVGVIDPRDTACVVPPVPADCVTTSQGGFTGYDQPQVGNESASYVMIDASVGGVLLTSHIAHELMHVGQHAYDYREPFWLKDSTATWGAVRVLQELDESRQPNFDYLPDFFKGLEKTLTRDTEEDLNRYASWLYMFFASMQKGDQIVTKMWENAAADGKQNEKAADAVFKFDTFFDNFAVQNWNQKPPLIDVYKDKDTTFPNEKPDAEPLVFFGGPEDSKITEELEPLSARYYRYQFGSPVKSVIFHNKLKGKPHAQFWGIARVNGEWQAPEDWTGFEQKGWCLDVPSQHLEELIIVFSNSDMTGKLNSSESSVVAKTAGCTNWQGTATWTYDITSGNSHSTASSVADVYFRNDQPPGTSSCGAEHLPCEVYYASGIVTFNRLDVVTQGCTTTIGPATATIGRTDGILQVYSDDPRHYEGTFMSVHVTGPGKTECPGDPVQNYGYDDPDIWFRAPAGMFQVKNNGALIEDSYTLGDYHYIWHLEPAP
jgi:hypothetical protein